MHLDCGIYQDIYYYRGDNKMMTAKVFENGRSQAIRLPKEYRFIEKEVYVSKIGDVVFIMPKSNDWDSLIQSLDLFSEDYMNFDRTDPEQIRDTL